MPAFHGAYTCKASVVVEPVLPPQLGGAAICDGSRSTVVVPITSTTGKVWMDRNLGASRAGTSSTDFEGYGCLYQWGRGNDGHASINWTSATAGIQVNGTIGTLATTDTPGHALFITTNGENWRSGYNYTRWQTGTQINNPCPTGYHVPTKAEINAEFGAYGITNKGSAYASPFKFVVAGLRLRTNGTLDSAGSYGTYWTSTNSNSYIGMFSIYNSYAIGDSYSAWGMSVRCIQN